MRSLVANTFLTLDGVMQAPGGPQEDPSGGFAHGGWSVNHWNDAMSEHMVAALNKPFELLLGRKTYEIFAAHWPYVDDETRAERGGTANPGDDPIAAALNNAVKYVASRTLTTVDWQNSVLLDGDVVEQVSKLKELDGPDIQVQGSASLLQTLIGSDLVDEFRIWTFPVVVGAGKRLFDDGTVPREFELLSTEAFDTGVILATYCRAGAVEHGSFAFEDPTDAEVERRRKLSGSTT